MPLFSFGQQMAGAMDSHPPNPAKPSTRFGTRKNRVTPQVRSQTRNEALELRQVCKVAKFLKLGEILMRQCGRPESQSFLSRTL